MTKMTSVDSPHITATRPARGLMATLNFIRPQKTKPEFQSAALTGGAPKLFFNMERHTVTIAEMRDIADTLSIDREGCRFITRRSRHSCAASLAPAGLQFSM